MSYDDSKINVLDYIFVDIEFKNNSQDNIKLYIVKNGGPALLGRDWLLTLKLNINIDIRVNNVLDQSSIIIQNLAMYL